MYSRLFFILLITVLSATVVNAGDAPEAKRSSVSADKARTGNSDKKPLDLVKAKYAHKRTELENKLRVEQVLLKGHGAKGVEIEVSYRIVDTESYAAHPKTSFVADEASASLVPLTRLAKLFTPLSAEEAQEQPPAKLTFWDRKGVIKPGQPVTVVVAGFGQKHVIPAASAEFAPASNAASQVSERSAMVSAEANIQVMKAKLVAGGHMLRIDFISKGIKELDTGDSKTYVENPLSGDRHPIAKVPRIGALAPRNIENKTSYMVIDNAGVRIKPGQQVTVVIGGVRVENVMVTAEDNIQITASTAESAADETTKSEVREVKQ